MGMNRQLVVIFTLLSFLVLSTPAVKADKVMASMHCVPTSIEPGDAVICDIDFKLLNPNETATLKLKKVYLEDKEIWPSGLSRGTVIVPNSKLHLDPHDIEGSITITLTFNREMADYYFGKPVLDDYSDKFRGRTYKITAVVDGLSTPVSTQIKIKNTGLWDSFIEALEYLIVLIYLISIAVALSVKNFPIGSLLLAVFSGFVGVSIARIASGLQWNLKYGYWSLDIPSLIFLIPIVLISALDYKEDKKSWKLIFTGLLWLLMVTAAKYGSNGDVLAIVLSLTLWVTVELVGITGKRVKAYKRDLASVIIAPYLIPISYHLLLSVSSSVFWISLFFIFLVSILFVNVLYHSDYSSKRYVALMSPALVLLFMATNSPYSLSYALPLLGIAFLYERWDN